MGPHITSYQRNHMCASVCSGRSLSSVWDVWDDASTAWFATLSRQTQQMPSIVPRMALQRQRTSIHPSNTLRKGELRRTMLRSATMQTRIKDVASISIHYSYVVIKMSQGVYCGNDLLSHKLKQNGCHMSFGTSTECLKKRIGHGYHQQVKNADEFL